MDKAITHSRLPNVSDEEYITPYALIAALEKQNKRQVVSRVGIANTENNCYINVVMQCLTYR